MSTDRLLALAAIAIAAVGLGLALWVVVWMRRVRRAQSALLSGGPVADLVEFAVGMQARQEHVERRAEELGELVTGAQAEGATPRDAAIVADACVDAARRIMTELLALRAGAPQGRA